MLDGVTEANRDTRLLAARRNASEVFLQALYSIRAGRYLGGTVRVPNTSDAMMT